MRVFVLLTAVCSLSAWCLSEKVFAQDEAKDLEMLQGEWRLETVYDQGDEPSGDPIGKTFKIKGNQLFASSEPKDALTIKLDPAKTPAHITMTDKNQTSLGIYEIVGKDTLRLYFTEGGGRPKEFPASKQKSKDDKAIYLVLSRKK